MTPKAWVILIVSILILVVMLQNIRDVSVQILLWRIDIPLVLLIFLTVIIGFIIGYFLSSISPKKRK
ncbi:MAG: LapA family protein [Candidatus Zixiibacteriota bacterium]|nr:MAG: LapA family protein [candidate division Zixibacteria bacterium]